MNGNTQSTHDANQSSTVSGQGISKSAQEETDKLAVEEVEEIKLTESFGTKKDINVKDQLARHRAYMAGFLAGGLWIILGIVILRHMHLVGKFSTILIETPINQIELLGTNTTSEADTPAETANQGTTETEVGRPASDLEKFNAVNEKNISQATSYVGETAKTLYTFLTPLATAVTAYFFKQEAENK